MSSIISKKFPGHTVSKTTCSKKFYCEMLFEYLSLLSNSCGVTSSCLKLTRSQPQPQAQLPPRAKLKLQNKNLRNHEAHTNYQKRLTLEYSYGCILDDFWSYRPQKSASKAKNHGGSFAEVRFRVAPQKPGKNHEKREF